MASPRAGPGLLPVARFAGCRGHVPNKAGGSCIFFAALAPSPSVFLADSIAKRLAERELTAISHPAGWPPDGCRRAAGSTRKLAESLPWGKIKYAAGVMPWQ